MKVVFSTSSFNYWLQLHQMHRISIHKLGVWYDGKIITKLHSGSKHTQFLSLRVIWQNPGFLFVLSLASRTQPKLTKQNHHTKHKTQTQRPINTQTKVLISLSYLFVPVLQPRPQPRPLLVFTTAHVGFPRFGSWIGYPNAFVGLQLGFHSSSIVFFFLAGAPTIPFSLFDFEISLHFRYSIFFSNSLFGFDFELWDWFYSTNLVFVLAALVGAS